jgi:hypothetical protein
MNNCDELKNNLTLDENSNKKIKLKYALAYNDVELLLNVITQIKDYSEDQICILKPSENSSSSSLDQPKILSPLEYALVNNDSLEMINVLLPTSSINNFVWEEILKRDDVFNYILKYNLLYNYLTDNEESITYIRNLIDQKIANSTLDKLKHPGNNSIDNIVFILENNTSITDLDLEFNRLPNDDITAIAKIKRLKILNLTPEKDNSISEFNIELLVNTTTLVSLALSNTFLKIDHLRSLSHNPSLTSLELQYCNIGDDGAIILSQSKKLKILDLSRNKNIGLEGIKALSQNLILDTLLLDHNDMSDEGCFILSQNKNLKTLTLYSNLIGEAAAIGFSLNPTLTELNISMNKGITLKGYKALGTNKTLKKLNISANNESSLNNKLINRIVTIFAMNRTLTDLNLAGNKITDDDIFPLSINTTLKNLNLTGNQITNRGAILLSENKTLEILNLDYNQIRDDGAIALSLNTTLKELNIDRNNITDSGTFAFAFNDNLVKLYIYSNPITNKTIKLLRNVNSQRKAKYENEKQNFLFGTNKTLGNKSSIFKITGNGAYSNKDVSKLIFENLKPLPFNFNYGNAMWY